MGRNYRQYISTAVLPETEIVTTKTVLPKTDPVETDAQRMKRLGKQYAASGERVKFLGGELGNRKWSVPSQRHVADGEPVDTYIVMEIAGGLFCECKFQQYHPGAGCGHSAQVEKWIDRKDADERRAARKAEALASLAAIQAIETERRLERKARRTEWEEEV